MAKNKNKNIVPIKSLKELDKEISYENFEYKEHFSLIARLVPNRDLEKLELEILDEKACKEEGFVYVFVIKDKIFKIGQSITNLKKRIQSYNCGKIEYRINGTNSTTNYFVLQSLLSINVKIEVYAYFPPKPSYEIFNHLFKDSYPPAKRAENIILKTFKENHKRLPIGCTQS